MSIKRTQNHIAQSRATLPVTIIYAALVWSVISLYTTNGWIEGALTFIAAILLMTLNNRNALIPFYSRSVSCTFLVLSAMVASTSISLTGAIVGTCLTAFYLIIFNSYQLKQSPGTVYFAFIFIGVISLYFIKILYFLPVLWLIMRTMIMNLSWRTFFASWLGIITPYWFLLGYKAYTGDFMAYLDHFVEVAHFDPPFAFSSLGVSQYINLGVITVLGVIGIIHFFLTSYTDKIRTRMFYECFTLMFFVTLAFMSLQPRLFPALLAILLVNGSPLFARFFTLTHSKASNISFLTILSLLVAYTAFNLWMLSTNY